MAALNPKARRGARKAALHALYQFQVTGRPILDIAAEVLADPHAGMVDTQYFQLLVNGASANFAELDRMIAPVTSRPLNDISPIELTILRIAIHELQVCIETPYPVVMNEAIELAKKYGAEDSHKYINGVLDKLISTVRVIEWQAANRK